MIIKNFIFFLTSHQRHPSLSKSPQRLSSRFPGPSLLVSKWIVGSFNGPKPYPFLNRVLAPRGCLKEPYIRIGKKASDFIIQDGVAKCQPVSKLAEYRHLKMASITKSAHLGRRPIYKVMKIPGIFVRNSGS